MNRKAGRTTQGKIRRALKAAWQHHQSGRLHEAGKIYRQVLKAEPRNADALGLLGMIALQLGDSEIAADLLCRAVLLQPTNPVAHRYLGDAYLDLHRSADAEACYRSSLALKGDDADVHNRLATALQAQGRLDEAERSYRQALEYGPTLAAGVHNNLGILHALQGRPHAAAAEYRRALAIDPGLAEAHCNLGGVLHRLGETDAAITHCHAALAAKPAQARGHNTLGLIYLDEHRIGDAATNFRLALGTEPALVSARLNLALAMRADGQSLEAVQVLFDGLASQPTSIPLRQALAQSLQRVPLGNADPQKRAILASLCGDDGISPLHLTHAVANIAMAHPAFSTLLRASRAGEDLLACAPAEVCAWTQDPLLMAALPRMTLPSIELERVLTGLRRSILLRAWAHGECRMRELAVGREFLFALARNCFLTGYAFFVAEDEAKKAAAVDDRLCMEMRRPSLGAREIEDLLTLAALYRRLRLLPGTERLLDIALADWSAAFQPIVHEQLLNPLREKEISQYLATITDIKDEVSRAVRQQYEDNPYPPG
jgi:tetratricopeptide (TPR) repeat protein